MFKKVFITLVCSIIFYHFSFAERDRTGYVEKDRTVGLSATVQVHQFGILVPIWLSDYFVLAPGFDFKYAQSVGTDFSVGLSPRYYFRKEIVSPYIGVRFGALFNIPSSENVLDEETQIDLVGGLVVGGEYFFNRHLGIGVEAQGNLVKSDDQSSRFGNPGGINFNTATVIFLSVYF